MIETKLFVIVRLNERHYYSYLDYICIKCIMIVESREELKSLSIDSMITEITSQITSNEEFPIDQSNKIESIKFYKKQFEMDHASNIVRDVQRQSTSLDAHLKL